MPSATRERRGSGRRLMSCYLIVDRTAERKPSDPTVRQFAGRVLYIIIRDKSPLALLDARVQFALKRVGRSWRFADQTQRCLPRPSPVLGLDRTTFPMH